MFALTKLLVSNNFKFQQNISLDHTFFSDSTNPSFEEGQDFVFRSRGFFIPSLTDQYFFILQSSAQMRLYVNPNGNDPQGAVCFYKEFACVFCVRF